MKSTSLILLACMLLEMLFPCVSVLAQMGPGKREERVGRSDTATRSERKMVSGSDRSLEVAERAIRLFYQGNVVVMSRSTLDSSKLEDGWYAYIVYNYETDKRAELAEIAEIEERHLAIYSSYGSWGFSGTLREIPYGDIHVVVVAENRSDITRSGKFRQVIQRLLVEPKIRFRAPLIIERLTKKGWAIGRLVDVNQDTLVIRTGLFDSAIYRVPASSFADIEIFNGRRRNTVKGLLIGWAIGNVVTAAVYKEVHDPGYYDPDVAFARRAERWKAARAGLIAVLISTAIGYNIKTDRWIDVPLKDLNLSVVPSQNSGMGAAVSFNF